MKRRCSHSWSRWGWIGVMALVACMTTASTAAAEGGNVRYSFEQAKVGGDDDYVLIPRADERLAGEVNAHRMEQAFESLRRAKPSTYGNSYADVTGDDPATATVNVQIGADVDERNIPFIMAEAIYTLTEFGVPEVHFPGHTEQGMTRADVWMPAYTLTVPVWKVMPPGPVTTAQVLMPDGSLESMEAVTDRWERDREAVVDDIYAFLDSEDELTVRMVIGALPDVGELRLDEVTPFLAHDERVIRQTALRALEGYEDEQPVLEAVLAAMEEEPSDSLRRQMGEYLGTSSHDEYNVEKPFFLIEEGDDEEAVEAVEGLGGRDDDERVVKVLVDALRDERDAVAMAASQSLDELGNYEELGQALDDGDVDEELRMAIAESLAEKRSSQERLVGLTYIAHERAGGYANQAIVGIADLPIDEAREQAEEFLADGSRERRLAAIDALVERNDVASVEALMAAADDQPEQRQMEEAAYDIMVSQGLDEIIDQTQSPTNAVQKVAYQAIGERAARDGGEAEAVSTIETGRTHGDDAIRGAAARSLGQIGTDDALAMLMEMSDDSAPVVRREVALALSEFSGDDAADIWMEYLEDDDPEVVAAAIDAMERREDDRALGYFEDMVDHDEPAVRASAIRAVTTFLPDRDSDTVRQHMALLSGAVNDDNLQVKHAALEQLGRFESAMAVTHIASQVGSRQPATRSAALTALADTGHDDAIPLIESALRDSEVEVRSQAVEALTRLVGSEARPTLEARMEEEDDPAVQEVIESHLQQI